MYPALRHNLGKDRSQGQSDLDIHEEHYIHQEKVDLHTLEDNMVDHSDTQTHSLHKSERPPHLEN